MCSAAVAVSAAMTAPQVQDGATARAVAVITGRVVSSVANSAPLGRAIVTVTGPGWLSSRSAITDDNGRFSIGDLRPGPVTITATRRGYVPGAYGSTRPGREGTRVLIAAGQTLDVTIALFPGAVLTGRISDEGGVPLGGLRVFAIDAIRPVVPSPIGGDTGALTDNRGNYRIYDLPPREYLVAAMPTTVTRGTLLRPSTSDVDSQLARLGNRGTRPGSPRADSAAASTPSAANFVPLFFPGTASMAEAARIKLGPGEVRDGLDFVVTPLPVVGVEGTVVTSEERSPESIQIGIVPTGKLQFFGLPDAGPSLARSPDRNGHFQFSNAVPGHYVITVRASLGSQSDLPSRGAGSVAARGRGAGRAAATKPIEMLYGLREFDVVGQPIAGLTVTLRRGARFSGRLALDAPVAIPNFQGIEVTLQPVRGTTGTTSGDAGFDRFFSPPPPVLVRLDGSFEMIGVPPGNYRPKVLIPPSTERSWWLKSAVVDGRDVLDSVLSIGLGAEYTNATLTLTSRRTELAGTLQSATEFPASYYFVIVMPADPALRFPESRRVRSTRPATDGAFRFPDLPPGDYLLIVLADLDPEWSNSLETLAEIAASGTKIAVADGETKMQHLRIAKPE